MRRDHHQAAALPEAALLKAIPRTEGFVRTAFIPTKAADAARNATQPCRVLLKTPGITLPGASLWRRPGQKARGAGVGKR